MTKDVTVSMDGYTPIGIVAASTLHGSALLGGFRLLGNIARIEFRNIGSSQITATGNVIVLFAKTMA